MTTTETSPTPVTLNTYASPESPSKFVTTGSGIDVESVTGDTAPLSPGTYDLTLRSEHGTEVANDTATVTVEPRSTSDLAAYTTRAVAPGEFGNATAVREAIADGTLTPATAATANDTVVYAVNATGLTGLPAAANASLKRGADLDRLDGLSFGVSPTGTANNESIGGDALGRTPNESAVHLDREGLYVVADGERAFGTETLPDPGATFEAGFRVDDDRLRRTAADDRHRATTVLTYAAADSTGASASADLQASGSTGTAGGSGSASGGSVGGSSVGGGSAGGGSTGGGSTGGSSTSGGSTAGSSTGGRSASGGGAGPAVSAGAGNATNAGSPGSSEESPGPDANRPAPRPGVGISIAPGTSEIPPSAVPPELFGPGGRERGAGDSPAAGSRSENGRSNDAGGGEGDGATSTESADSIEPSDSSAPSDLGYDEAPIRSTVYDLPGFDAAASLAALAGASLLARRRGRGS
ncbi:hypothetical protein DVK07_06460 [Halorubrum sp. Atlit-26R]|nr:hypothetical protein DVK07_06460 [Halorubrum sp. Atlit-26R]